MIKESDCFQPGDRVAVLLPLPLAGAYDYRVPEGATLRPGDVVRVPLGKRFDTGVVWGAGSQEVPETKIKDVSGRLDAPRVSDSMRTFVDWVASYTLNAPGAVLKMALSVPDALEPPKPKIGYRVADSSSDAPSGLRLTPARQRVLDVAKSGALSALDLARAADCTTSVVTGLVKAGLLEAVNLEGQALPTPDPEHPGPELSEAQGAAAKALTDKVGAGFSVSLLDGVTGSGKTEVYFEAVAEALRRGQQVLVMLPEIALSAQWLGRFEARFGCPPAMWHSDLTHATRRDTWRAIAEGRAPVVVGARSSLFLPFPNLGLIIIDEEHDAAYKQEEGVIYNARDMAVVRGRLSACPVVPTTATPSLETAINAESGRYERLHLPERHAAAVMPEICAIDMRENAPSSGEWLHSDLVKAVNATLEAGEQAMLFLNRRGYAPLTLCRTCGHRLQCPRCTTWLVEHRRTKRLMCHHCGYQTRLPETCPSCEDKDSLAACGPGVERLAEEAQDKFPEARIAIASSDNLTSPAAAAELVRAIESHEVDLIIGTQIVSKGYHFPMLTLVGVVDGDLGLSGGDLRAAERTYQLLHQVAGRAGRAERPGRVMIQTYMPDHAVMRALIVEGRDAFLKAEAKQRKAATMPPFGRLAALIVSGRDETAVDEIARDLGRTAPHGPEVQVLGPAPAPLAMLRGKHRRRLLLKTTKSIGVQGLLKEWLSRVKVGRNVRVQVDIDPYSFL